MCAKPRVRLYSLRKLNLLWFLPSLGWKPKRFEGAEHSPSLSKSHNSDNRVILIGCGRRKEEFGTKAKNLYTGCLFRARRAYAEASGCPWFIISALHELVEPERVLEPYDYTMKQLRGRYREQWACRVLRTLQSHAPLAQLVEVHAGAAYFLPLHDALHYRCAGLGFRLEWPVEGLTQGYQLRFYSRLQSDRFARQLL
jgi:hypothetical protein